MSSIKNNRLVTVVIPSHNRADILSGALESVWQQTYRPIELILVDDGSTDDTKGRVHKWADRRKSNNFNIHYLYQENKGANAARNKGISNASSKFIAFLDSDDRWLPEKLEKQIFIFRKDPEIGGVYCGLRHVVLETGEHLKEEKRSYPQGLILSRLLVHDVTEGTPTWIIRKECFGTVGMFDVNLPARQDWDMWVRLASQYKIGCVPEILVEAGEHLGERVRSNPMNEIQAARQIFQKYASLRRQFPLWVSLAARSAMYRRRGRVYFHRGLSVRKAFGLQLLAICVWPFVFDSYAALAGMFIPGGLRQKIHILWNRIFGKTRLAIRSH